VPDVLGVGIGRRDDTVAFNAGELAGDAERLMGSMYGGCDLHRDSPRSVALWRAGKLDIEGLISARIAFGELNRAVSALREGNVVRQVVAFG
jgi:S-(hydroxymethyl)glutathione dehydrogenase/alcohol dehydrogenase